MKCFFIYPNQLFRDIDMLKNMDRIYLIEDPLYFFDKERKLKMNKLKLVLHRASMKYYYDYLEDNRIPVTYIDYHIDAMKTLYGLVKRDKITEIYCYDPVDHLLVKRLSLLSKTNKIGLNILDTPNFINSNSVIEKYIKQLKNPRRLVHNSFYIFMRKTYKILLDKNGDYIGGKLSFDVYNRKTIGKDTPIYRIKPKKGPIFTREKSYVEDAQKYVEEIFPDHYGNTTNINHMTFTHDTAENAFNDFLKNRLKHFGDYQDAISLKNPFLYHSNISHALNIGLLDPMDCIIKTVKQYEKNQDIGINNVEGFVRQILGWREFSRLIYHGFYDRLKNSNFMNATNKLTDDWYKGTTGWKPVDITIRQAFDYGYLHHIQRLMVMGNIMNLMKFHPHEVYRWYMEFAIDSYDWVMTNNIYSMILFADGGFTTTKPYVASDNYIFKMSNGQFKKDGIWDRDLRILFYNYIATSPKVNFIVSGKTKKMNYFYTNRRTRLMYYGWVKKEGTSEGRKIIEDAKKIFAKLTNN